MGTRIDCDVVKYLRHVALEGVPARYRCPVAELKSKAHNSLRGHM